MRSLLLIGLPFVSVLAPLCTLAQPASPMPRVGVVLLAPPPDPFIDAFREGMRELGYIEGRTVEIDYRSARGNPEMVPELIADIVRLKVAVLVTGGEPGAPAAKKATRTIPVVFAVHADPVGAGLAASLARPGGNLTGLASLTADLARKRLELLKEAVPNLSRIAVLRDPRQPIADLRLVETAARALGLRLHVFETKRVEDFEKALAAAKQVGAQAVINLQSAFFSAHRERLVSAVTAARLPAMYHHLAFVDAGGLMAYSAVFRDLYRRAATYVDKILKGANPTDIPVEQPTKFEFVVNLRAAKATDVSIPPALLLRADRVIDP